MGRRKAPDLVLRAGEQHDAATAKAALIEFVKALARQQAWADHEAEVAMTDHKQSVVVEVYRDATKGEKLLEVPIIDLGVQTSAGAQPSGDAGLIHIAKLQVGATRLEDPDTLHYEVRRK